MEQENSEIEISQIKHDAIEAISYLTDEQCRTIIKELRKRMEKENERKNY